MRHICVFMSLGALACGSPSGGSGSVDREAIVKTCALEVSCLGDAALLPTVAGCVDDFQLGIGTGAGIFFGPSASQLRHIVECGGAASDCDSGLECASFGHGPEYCASHPGSSCDGAVRVVCDAESGWAVLSEDCADRGLECIDVGGAAGSRAVCTDGRSCDPTMDAGPICEGSRLVRCTSDGLRSSTDCAGLPIDATCGTYIDDAGAEQTGCVSTGPACVAADARCEGTVAIGCGNGREVRLDCAALVEGHCEAPDGGLRCVPDASECSAADPDRCEGPVIVTCVNGRRVQIPCADLSLATCVEAADGARCAP